MALTSRSRIWLLAIPLVLVGGGVAVYFLWPRPHFLPGPRTPEYREYVRLFRVGVAALDAGREDLARKNLERAVELIPAEPASWANLGLFFLRKNNLEKAEKKTHPRTQTGAGERRDRGPAGIVGREARAIA